MNNALIGILTGPVGAGKTTVAEHMAGLAHKQGLICGGLLAPAIKNSCGQKVGIWGIDLRTAERRILARTDRDLEGPTIGPYSFDAAALAWSVTVIDNAIGHCDLLIVDEIGKLELWQGIGLAPILPRLKNGEATRSLVLVRESLQSELQDRLNSVLQIAFKIDENNRNALPKRILAAML